jgi:putative endonuclease
VDGRSGGARRRVSECEKLEDTACRSTGRRKVALETETANFVPVYRVPYPLQSSLWRADGTRKQFSVYIVSNTSMTLYTGVTNDLRRRVFEHKNGIGCEFTSRYHFDRLVYFETFEMVVDAIAREKAIKGMNRKRKIEMIKTVNASWRDLSEEL